MGKHHGTLMSTTSRRTAISSPDADRLNACASPGRTTTTAAPSREQRHAIHHDGALQHHRRVADAARRLATDTGTDQEHGKGNAKPDARRASASVVGPHDGGSETQGVPEYAAGREPDNSTRGDGALASQRGESVPLRTDNMTGVYRSPSTRVKARNHATILLVDAKTGVTEW